jgi:hypothetical protein
VTLGSSAFAASPNFGNVTATAPERPAEAPQPRVERSARPQSAWEAGLNAYFNASFTSSPSPAALLDALAAHLNRRTLDGIPPSAERKRFQIFAKDIRKQHRQWRDEIDSVERLHATLLDYLECEAAFHEDRDAGHLRRLSEIVIAYAAFTPEYPADRAEFVAKTVKEEQRFAPASVVFGVSLLPWRPIGLAPGERLLEVPVQPEYTDASDRALALLDFGCAPGPVKRLDFDTVDAGRVELAVPEPASGYRAAAQRETESLGGVLSPLLVSPPVSVDRLQLTVWPQQARPVLRNLRVFAVKPRPQLSATRGMACTIDGRPDEASWLDLTWVGGFVLDGEPAFARSQTRFAVFYDQEALYIGVRAYETRMDTLAAQMTGRDAALWEEEAVEVRLRAHDRIFRLLVNPLDAVSDSQDGDWAWNGRWRAAAFVSDDLWQAEFAIPWEMLGLQGPSGVELNVLRYRHNVQDELSAWAVDAAGAGAPDAWVAVSAH